MIPGKRYTPELVLSIAWRRKWLIVLPTVMVALLACGVTYFLPDRFRSEATILVVPPRVSETYVRQTLTTKIEDRLRSINQQVRSRTKLERIIEQFNLYADRRQRDIMQDIVDDMSNDIDVDIVQGDVFRIAFTADSPRTAQLVTQQLTTFFIDESLKDRTDLVVQQGEFLQTQVQDVALKLRATEQKLEESKRKHDGELPTQSDSNLQAWNSANMQLQTVGRDLSDARELQVTMQRQIAQLTAQAEAAANAPPPPVQEAPQNKASQLAAARTQLQGLLAKYKPGYPDVVRLEAKIATLEREAAEEAATAPPPGPRAVAANPVVARNLKALDDARTDLERIERRIENLLSDQRRLQGQIAEYQRRIDAAPARDSELIELTRDYTTLKASYDSLSMKKIDSELSANLERGQIGEQFRTLDPARLPERPDSPNRERYYMLSIVLAIAVGLGVAAGAEYFDRSLRSEDDVRLALALPVLATIPEIGTPKTMSLRQKFRLGSAATVMLAVVASAAWLVLRSR